MADIDVKASSWKYVEVGRVVLFLRGTLAGRLAAIVEIIDHKRVRNPSEDVETYLSNQVLIDGPSKDSTVPRHSAPLSNLLLTPIVLNIPRAIGHGPLKKKWEEDEVDSKWSESPWAKAQAQREKRKNLTDFERFKVMRLRKQVR